VDNRSFWNHRYIAFPQIGSGPGSRGYATAIKKKIIRQAIEKYKIKSILDIGCGDVCWLDDEITNACTYTGCDIAETIIERNKAERSVSSHFLLHDIVSESPPVTADLVICFDVLIHQTVRAEFIAALANILSAIGKVGLVSYRSPPTNGVFPPSPPVPSNASAEATELDKELLDIYAGLPRDHPRAETAFHGPLSEIIRSIRGDMLVEAIGEYRVHTVYEIRHDS